jgi:hypothetical protein
MRVSSRWDLPPPARAKGDIGGIGCLPDEGLNAKTVIPAVIPADVHPPDEAALGATHNRKCDSKPHVVQLS